MDDVELEQYMSALPESRGVFASDELPSLPSPSIFAVNLDPRHLPGSHWVVLYFGKDKAEYFDPLGEPPTPSLNRYLLQHSDGYMWNNMAVQGPSSDKCGHFCIYYSYFKSKGFTMSCILRSFTMDYAINDYIVEQFVKNEM